RAGGHAMIRRPLHAWLAAIAAVLLPVVVTAQEAPPLLHAMFSDHAVLQRDQPIRVYGEAPPGASVRVELAGRRVRARADGDGHWEASLPALRAGGPYELVATAGDRSQRVRDVLVGDVWLCSGQSN